jgi:hypothetical protein
MDERAALVVETEQERPDRRWIRGEETDARDDAVDGSLALHLDHPALPGHVRRCGILCDDAVDATPREHGEPFGGDVRVARLRRREEIGRMIPQQLFEPRATFGERPRSEVVTIEREQVERNERGGRLTAQLVDARRRRAPFQALAGVTDAGTARGRRRHGEEIDDAGRVGIARHETQLHVVARRSLRKDVTVPERKRAAREDDAHFVLRHCLTGRGNVRNTRDGDAPTELVSHGGDELRVEPNGESDGGRRLDGGDGREAGHGRRARAIRTPPRERDALAVGAVVLRSNVNARSRSLVCGGSRLRRERSPLVHALEHLAKAVARQRFFHNRVGTDITSITRARDDDDAEISRVRTLAELVDQRAAVHPRQLEVDQRRLDAGLPLRELERTLAIVRVEHAIPIDFEDVAEEVGGRRLVLDDEDARRIDRIRHAIAGVQATCRSQFSLSVRALNFTMPVDVAVSPAR